MVGAIEPPGIARVPKVPPGIGTGSQALPPDHSPPKHGAPSDINENTVHSPPKVRPHPVRRAKPSRPSLLPAERHTTGQTD